jgi:hypothetical protein
VTRFYWLAVAILAVWRVTHFCTAEGGPWLVMARLRRRLATVTGELFTCFYCLSVWISAPLAAWLGESWPERLLLWPAVSAGTILLERVTEVQPAPYREDPDDPAAPSPPMSTP